MPLLGKRFVREAADKAADRRLALCDLVGNEYAPLPSVQRKDLPRLLFDAQDGTCLRQPVRPSFTICLLEPCTLDHARSAC